MLNFFYVRLCTYKVYVIKKYTILSNNPDLMMYFIPVKYILFQVIPVNRLWSPCARHCYWPATGSSKLNYQLHMLWHVE